MQEGRDQEEEEEAEEGGGEGEEDDADHLLFSYLSGPSDNSSSRKRKSFGIPSQQHTQQRTQHTQPQQRDLAGVSGGGRGGVAGSLTVEEQKMLLDSIKRRRMDEGFAVFRGGMIDGTHNTAGWASSRSPPPPSTPSPPVAHLQHPQQHTQHPQHPQQHLQHTQHPQQLVDEGDLEDDESLEEVGVESVGGTAIPKRSLMFGITSVGSGLSYVKKRRRRPKRRPIALPPTEDSTTDRPNNNNAPNTTTPTTTCGRGRGSGGGIGRGSGGARGSRGSRGGRARRGERGERGERGRGGGGKSGTMGRDGEVRRGNSTTMPTTTTTTPTPTTPQPQPPQPPQPHPTATTITTTTHDRRRKGRTNRERPEAVTEELESDVIIIPASSQPPQQPQQYYTQQQHYTPQQPQHAQQPPQPQQHYAQPQQPQQPQPQHTPSTKGKGEENGLELLISSLRLFRSELHCMLPVNPLVYETSALSELTSSEQKDIHLSFALYSSLAVGCRLNGQGSTAKHYYNKARDVLEIIFDEPNYSSCLSLMVMLYYAVFIEMDLERASYYATLATTSAALLGTLQEHVHLRCIYVNLMLSPPLDDIRNMRLQAMREGLKIKKFGDQYPCAQDLLEVETFNHILKLWTSISSGLEIIKLRHDPVKDRASFSVDIFMYIAQLDDMAVYCTDAQAMAIHVRVLCELAGLALKMECHLLLGDEATGLSMASIFVEQFINYATMVHIDAFVYAFLRRVLEVLWNFKESDKLKALLNGLEPPASIFTSFASLRDHYINRLERGTE